MARKPFDPQNLEPFFEKSFITESGSRYEIIPSNTTIKPQFRKIVPNGRADSGIVYAVAGIKSGWFGTGLFGINERKLDRAIGSLAIPGYFAQDKTAYEMRLSEAKMNITEFLEHHGREPRKGDRLFLAIERDFEYYNSQIKNNPNKAFPFLTPFILTSPIKDIIPRKN